MRPKALPPGACEAHLWSLVGLRRIFNNDNAREVHWVAAESLDAALRYTRRHDDFTITEARLLGMIALSLARIRTAGGSRLRPRNSRNQKPETLKPPPIGCCQLKGFCFEYCLSSQTNSHYEFSALPVDAPACTGAKMANTCGKILSQRGAHCWPTRPR
ncbi:hypothetical protein SBA4_4700002 [Candidatus Sulfopaludibacter sp. SbA4]|nr:hypothetical protein SBA4_4700002 [Candidatus Sulfopaludibacter sp. SbA4]